MIISETSFAVFEASARQQFAAEMLVHLRGFAPELAESAGEEALRELIRTGIDRAREYGFQLRGPVQLFLEMKLAFGSDFDRDPQCFHFESILRPTGGDEMARARTLFAASKEYFDLVASYDDLFARRALLRMRAETHAAPTEPPGSLLGCALNEFREWYPEKCSYLGREALTRLVAMGTEFAARRQPGRSVFGRVACGLMFAFGSGVFADPMYPWVQRTMREFATQPDELPTQLFRQFHLHLTRLSSVPQ